MKKIHWKKAKGGRIMEHLLEGFVDNEKIFIIEGRLCVSDLRPMCKAAGWQAPKHYKLNSDSPTYKEDAKLIAHELLNGINLENVRSYTLKLHY